jgi:hypothetical protein
MPILALQHVLIKAAAALSKSKSWNVIAWHIQMALPETMVIKKEKNAGEMITSIFFVLLTSLTGQTCGQSWT